MLAATPSVSLARSESFTRSRAGPRLVRVSNGLSSPPAEEPLHVSNYEQAQTRNTNLKTSRPFVLGQAPRSSPYSTVNNGTGMDSTPERPNTSGGHVPTLTGWNRSQWDQLKKNRQSRDDTYFTLLKGNKVERSEITANRGILKPTGLPTPDATPPRGPSPEEALIAERVEMIEHNHQNGSGIGMALGSPMHPQQDWSQAPYRVNTNEQVREPQRPTEAASPVSPAGKQKSKWKGLGSLFGRKAPKPSTAFYRLDDSNSPEGEQNINYGSPTSPDSATSKSRGMSNTTSSKKRTALPTRANTLPDQRRKGGKNSDQKSQGVPEIQFDGGPMLDVEIPSIQLDRYSVMFSGVLGKGGIESSSSLLARRQATLDKLKTVNEAIAEAEREEAQIQKQLRTRRVTSPQPTKSPAFSLFPTTGSATSQTVPRTPSPLDQLRPQNNNKSGLTRSNTSPAALSPNRSTFHSDAESHIIMLDDGKALLNGISTRNAMNKKTVQFSTQESTLMLSPQSMDSETLPFSPPYISRSRRQEESSRMSSSPSDSEEEELEKSEEEVQVHLKPKLTEPDWQIINPAGTQSETRPFKKEIELIDKINSPIGRRGRSQTITQESSLQSSLVTSPTSSMTNPLSPLRSNPVPTSPRPSRARVQSPPISQQPQSPPLTLKPLAHTPSTSSGSTSNSTSTTTSSPPRRARSIKEIRADIDRTRLRSASRSRQRELQREAERLKIQADLEEAERTLESAAGLSIQRQISMSQRQRQLLAGLPTTVSSGINMHRKPVGSGSVSSIGVGGLGSSRENDAMLLSNGGFNAPVSSISTTNSSPSGNTGTSTNGTAGFGFDFNNYERPQLQNTEKITIGKERSRSPAQQQVPRNPSSQTTRSPSRNRNAGMGASTMSAGNDSNGRIHSTINMGAMGMGAVLKQREIASATPLVIGHRYQRSERVVMDG